MSPFDFSAWQEACEDRLASLFDDNESSIPLTLDSASAESGSPTTSPKDKP